MNRTTGDQYQVECPACGKIIRDLWDLGDGLHEGAKIDCGHCGTEVTVDAVDITVDVTLVANTSITGGTSIECDQLTDEKGERAMSRIISASKMCAITGGENEL